MLEQVPDRLMKQGVVDRLELFQQHALIEMMRLRRIALEEPTLHRRQRNRAGHKALLRLDSRCGTNNRRELRYCLVFKHVSRCELETGLICLGNDLKRDNRVAAQLEEVIPDANR